MIQNNGGGYDKPRSISGTWDLSKYGLRPAPTVFIDNYNYPLSPNPDRRTDTVPQNTVKTTNEFDRKEAYLGSMYSLGWTQTITPRPADSTEPLIKRSNAMKAYLVPVNVPDLIPKDIPINKFHFVYNRDTSDKLLKLGVDTCPPTLNSLKNQQKIQ